MSDIFFSYASEDRERVRPLVEALVRRGWSVWWDRIIPAGKTFDGFIDEQLTTARSVVVVWTRVSIKKHWVLEEAEDGRERGVLIPVSLDAVKGPRGFRRIQAADLADWDGSEDSPAFLQLVSDLAELIGSPVLPDETDETTPLAAPATPDQRPEQETPPATAYRPADVAAERTAETEEPQDAGAGDTAEQDPWSVRSFELGVPRPLLLATAAFALVAGLLYAYFDSSTEARVPTPPVDPIARVEPESLNYTIATPGDHTDQIRISSERRDGLGGQMEVCLAHATESGWWKGLGLNETEPTIEGEKRDDARCTTIQPSSIEVAFWKAKIGGIHRPVGMREIDLSAYADHRITFTWEKD